MAYEGLWRRYLAGSFNLTCQVCQSASKSKVIGGLSSYYEMDDCGWRKTELNWKLGNCKYVTAGQKIHSQLKCCWGGACDLEWLRRLSSLMVDQVVFRLYTVQNCNSWRLKRLLQLKQNNAKQFQNKSKTMFSFRRTYMWNKTLKQFQNVFELFWSCFRVVSVSLTKQFQRSQPITDDHTRITLY